MASGHETLRALRLATGEPVSDRGEVGSYGFLREGHGGLLSNGYDWSQVRDLDAQNAPARFI
jgi:hypothetical protein